DEAAGRADLVQGEKFEISVLQEFLPAQMSEAEVDELIAKALSETGASGMKDMSKVMSFIKPLATGRTDMGSLSKKIKDALNK
ncbi:MAG: GatB/YqeY domain-containing protein, partial [Acutalibacteraceae bacterium]|nr:GatB/YqeY domain-containing protein [Acutalibacteraceae bacterium]